VATLASFDGTDGANPVAGLVLDGSGNLYGTTSLGGPHADGTVFEIAAGSGAITTLASFAGANGAFPEAGLVQDGSGNLYGTTASGGAHGDGTVFEVAKRSGAITRRASFNGANGAFPVAGLVMDGSGNLYGTTVFGGASGEGTVFEVAKRGGRITTLASFDGSDGANPYAGLVLDGGNLYGTTQLGGAGDLGTVFELSEAAAPTDRRTHQQQHSGQRKQDDRPAEGHGGAVARVARVGGHQVGDLVQHHAAPDCQRGRRQQRRQPAAGTEGENESCRDHDQDPGKEVVDHVGGYVHMADRDQVQLEPLARGDHEHREQNQQQCLPE
jgi:uncharacterized repeat protein (TIGR03803 family)